MARDWVNIRLADVCRKIGSGATPRGGSSVYLDTGPIAFVRSQNIYNDGFSKEGIVYLSHEIAKGLDNVQIEESDILLNITGESVARVCQIENSILPARVNQHVAIIRTDKNKLSPGYLRYFLTTPAMQAHMLALAAAGATRNALTKSMIESFIIKCPESIGTQKLIAAILTSFDEKIALNCRINQTLEAMAQALFKSWFVDFDGVPRKDLQKSELGLIPKGWRVGILAELCHLNSESWSAKTLPRTVSYIDLANVKNGEVTEVQIISGGKIPSRARRVVKRGDTIVGTVRPGNRSFAFIGEPELTASTGFAVLRPVADEWREFVYITATSESNIERLTQLADGGAYPAVRPEVVAQGKLAIPPLSLVQLFHKQTQPLFLQLFSNKEQTRSLSTLRDTLLPKLLSGEISINNLNKEER